MDEGILLADRIIPLSAGPERTLGPSFQIDIPRPRDRKAINHDPRFKEIRREVIDYLLGSGRRGHGRRYARNSSCRTSSRRILSRAARYVRGARQRPMRRSEIKQETVEVGS